ncbi:MAG: bifunctional precorrin-2 dehydrogenase/sirohydrochlorin ferrochelatase [Elusimicrobia bacterium]|nr:bifunctional precorrin-2 dehydrogenase/sirohydrochlorin ferrochelatase [Elusimicrobiota bacterium]
MRYLPISLNIADKKILIIGGGKIAYQKIKTLKQFSKSITVVAPYINDEIKKCDCDCKEKNYESKDLNGVFIVYACTNNKNLNTKIRIDAQKKCVLINVVDSPQNCDFISPAIYKKGYMTIAVSSDGRDVKKSIIWRNKIKDIFEK